MITVLRSIFHRLGGLAIGTGLLLLAALTTIALGLGSMIRGLDGELALTVVSLGLITGWILARSRLPGWLAGLLALGLGSGVDLIRVGHLGGELVLLLRAWAEFAWKIGSWQISRSQPDAQPALQILAQFAGDVATLVGRLRDWLVIARQRARPASIRSLWL